MTQTIEGLYRYYEGEGRTITVGGRDLIAFIADNEELPDHLFNQKVRITIEVLEDEVVDEDEPIINFTLRQIIRNDDAIKGLRLNPYCMNEGADPNARYEIKLSDAKKWGLV